MLPGHVVMQRAAFAQRHLDQIPLGGFRSLADRLRYLARLAVAEADTALLVADDDERGEAEAPSALHHLGHPIDMHELIDELAVALAIIAVSSFRASAAFAIRHTLGPLEVQSCLAGSIGECPHPPMVEITAAVEHDLGDAGLKCPLGNELAHGLRRGEITALFARPLEIL